MNSRVHPTHSSRRSLRFYLQSLGTPILLGMLCLLVYNANLRQIGAGDTLPARYLPLILWHNGTLALDANAGLVAHGHSLLPPRNRPEGVDGKVLYFEPWTYWLVRTQRHELASLYPVVAPLLVAPVYLPAVIWLNHHGWEQPQIDRVAELMEKLSASFLASIATILMYLVLRRECGRWSLPLALVFAFGTNTWMISSQALWQHGAGELLIALALLLVLSLSSPLRFALLGAVCVLMAANRPPDALIAGAIGLYTIWTFRSRSLWLLAGAAIPLAAVLYYNLEFIGHLAGGYGFAKAPQDKFFHLDWTGIAGLLVSPARGLLVFTPFLLFVPFGLYLRLRSPNSRGLAVALSFAVVAQLLLYSQADWRAGESWGPRWLTDLLPILLWMLAPVALVLRPFARGLLVLAMAASIAVQVIGAFWYTKTSDDLIFAGDPSSMQGAWNPRNVPFLTELRHPPARSELQRSAAGSIDVLGSTLRPRPGDAPPLETGDVLEGWALFGGRTPSQVFALIDGVVVGSTGEFSPRTDINKAMHTLAPSGWRMSVDTLGVPAGERVLQLAVRFKPRSDIRIIREQRVSVFAPQPLQESATIIQKPVTGAELKTMAARAEALLRERQSKDGFWLTTFTKGVRYKKPKQEMNTFTTSILVDLLSPVASHLNLEDVVERARTHLAAQIESNGLVRYHGLPDGPGIGTLGCVITPDADDTALVWRIAGPGAKDPKLKGMLEELARYRDSRGLYRTWLAPRADYQNLDPGLDPNPTDIIIQMHVYLMLRELDPPDAQKLCDALQRSWGDENLWIYYAKAPLLPYLRSVELRQLGCKIPLPGDRLALPPAGQETWTEAVHLFAAAMTSPPDAKTRDAIDNLLARLGRSDFAQLRLSPPMLYHNDLSATVKRFYWSEDFGYALWLRLYEVAHGKTIPPSSSSP